MTEKHTLNILPSEDGKLPTEDSSLPPVAEGLTRTETPADCSVSDRDLYLAAKAMLPMAYAPYSKFHVGAALLGADGKIYTGVNVENCSFGATICAERTACVKAVSEGCQSFVKLAIVSGGGEAWPCGICRQFLYEFCRQLPVITGADEDHLRVLDISQLLMEGFKL